MTSHEVKRTIEVQGLEVAVDVHGEGDPVILLHGFPDTRTLWRHQIEPLVAAGRQVIVPDLRGRGETAIAPEVEDYLMFHLIQDVAGILDALKVERAAVVGHDWGSALAWAFASFMPSRTAKLVAMSVGHPSSFMTPDVRQLQRSWYMWLFKLPGVAEQLFPANDWEVFRGWLAGQAEAEEFIEDLSRPGRLTAGLNWYRANIMPEAIVGKRPELPAVACPVMGVWSSRDFALTEEQMSGSGRYVSGPWRYERIEGAGHWIPRERPDEVNALLIDFLGG